ncbi:hypothetical protein GCM10022287_02050 [Gryllotalpicola koreensis]|uniref:DUF6916 domain-containing protein n=2 Tax=Gryllotalpicola koreensis TaxID=993086 RepID=A0ABP7ZQA3_9MICO
MIRRDAAAKPSEAASSPASVPGRSAWLGLVGAEVAVSGHGGLRALRLSAVQDLPQATAGDEDRYSLLFATPVPVDGIVAFHGLATPVELYLSPVTQQQRTTAQAVISRA